MRLIDADALKEKFKEHYDFFVSAYKNEQDMSLADKARVDEILNSMAEVINAPTVCGIEQIRDEIEEWGKDECAIRHGCFDEVLRIIDKYTGARK